MYLIFSVLFRSLMPPPAALWSLACRHLSDRFFLRLSLFISSFTNPWVLLKDRWRSIPRSVLRLLRPPTPPHFMKLLGARTSAIRRPFFPFYARSSPGSAAANLLLKKLRVSSKFGRSSPRIYSRGHTLIGRISFLLFCAGPDENDILRCIPPSSLSLK